MRLPAQSTRVDLEAGYSANEATLREMARLVRKDYLEPRIIARSRQLAVGTKANDFAGRVRRVWDHVVGRVTFLGNPRDAQRLTSPVELDREIDEGTAAEACASLVTYAAALFAALGYEAVFVAMGPDVRRPEMSHVALAVRDPKSGEVIQFDPSAFLQAGYPLGASVADPQRMRIEVWDSLEGTMISSNRSGSGLRATAFGDVDVNTIVDTSLDVLTDVANMFGPYGQMVGSLIQIGDKIYDMASGQQVAAGQPPPITIPPPKPNVALTPSGKPIIALTNRAREVNPNFRQTVINKPKEDPKSSAAPVIAAGVGLSLLAYLL